MPRYMPADLFTQAALTVAFGHAHKRTDLAVSLAASYSTYADSDLADKLEESAAFMPELLAAFHKDIEGDPGSLSAYLLMYLKAIERFQPTGRKRYRVPFLNGTWFRFQRKPPKSYVAQSTAVLIRYCGAVGSGAINFGVLRELVRASCA